MKSYFFGENGQSLAEYALVVGLMSVVLIAVFVLLAPQIYEALHDAIEEDTAREAEEQMEDTLLEENNG